MIFLKAVKDIMFLLHTTIGAFQNQGTSQNTADVEVLALKVKQLQTAVSRLFRLCIQQSKMYVTGKTKEKNKGKKKEEVYSAFSSKWEECAPGALFLFLLTSFNITQQLFIRAKDK